MHRPRRPGILSLKRREKSSALQLGQSFYYWPDYVPVDTLERLMLNGLSSRPIKSLVFTHYGSCLC